MDNYQYGYKVVTSIGDNRYYSAVMSNTNFKSSAEYFTDGRWSKKPIENSPLFYFHYTHFDSAQLFAKINNGTLFRCRVIPFIGEWFFDLTLFFYESFEYIVQVAIPNEKKYSVEYLLPTLHYGTLLAEKIQLLEKVVSFE